jgi:hypothetical protein
VAKLVWLEAVHLVAQFLLVLVAHALFWRGWHFLFWYSCICIRLFLSSPPSLNIPIPPSIDIRAGARSFGGGDGGGEGEGELL